MTGRTYTDWLNCDDETAGEAIETAIDPITNIESLLYSTHASTPVSTPPSIAASPRLDYTSCCSTPEHFQMPGPDGLSTADYLATVSTHMLEFINHHSIEEFTQLLRIYTDAQYHVRTGVPENQLTAQTREHHIDNLTSYFRANPNYHVQVQNTAIQVDDKLRRALVFHTTRVRGILGAENVVRESVNLSYWKRRPDKMWVAVRLETLRGPGHSMF